MGFYQTRPLDSEDDPLHRRIVLLGKTGSGKSATGNTILGEKRFRSVTSSSSITSESEIQHGLVSGRNVSVIDTPATSNTAQSPQELGVEIRKSIYLSSPGPHAFLYVQPINIRFTEQEEDSIEKLELIFGKELRRYTMILFTYGDLLEEESIDMLIQKSRSLGKLVEQCGGRYHIFNNKHLRNRDQVSELLQKVDRIVEENGGTCYSIEMFEKAKRIRQEAEEVLKRREEAEKLKQKLKNLLFVPGFVEVVGGVIGAIVYGYFAGFKRAGEGAAIFTSISFSLRAIGFCIYSGLCKNLENHKQRRLSTERKNDGGQESPDLDEGTSDRSHSFLRSNVRQRSKVGECENQD